MPRWVCPAPRTRRSCRASCLRGTELRGPGGVRGCVRRAGRRGTVQIELVETEVGRVVLRRQVEGAGDLLHAGGHPCGGEFGGRRHARRRGARQQRRERREQRRRRGQQHGIGISAIPVSRRISSAISRGEVCAMVVVRVAFGVEYGIRSVHTGCYLDSGAELGWLSGKGDAVKVARKDPRLNAYRRWVFSDAGGGEVTIGSVQVGATCRAWPSHVAFPHPESALHPGAAGRLPRQRRVPRADARVGRRRAWPVAPMGARGDAWRAVRDTLVAPRRLLGLARH